MKHTVWQQNDTTLSRQNRQIPMTKCTSHFDSKMESRIKGKRTMEIGIKYSIGSVQADNIHIVQHLSEILNAWDKGDSADLIWAVLKHWAWCHKRCQGARSMIYAMSRVQIKRTSPTCKRWTSWKDISSSRAHRSIYLSKICEFLLIHKRRLLVNVNKIDNMEDTSRLY